MNKDDLKKIIKPIVKECISEILIQEGLKSLNKEVVSENYREEQPILQEKVKNKGKIDFNKVFKKDIVEKNKKLGFDMDQSGFNPFQGTISTDVLEKIPSPEQKKVGNLINESSGEWTRILDALKARK